MKKIEFFLFLFILLVACKKENPSPTTNTDDLDVSFVQWEDTPCDPNSSIQGGNINDFPIGRSYRYPVFNPNNWNEIIYVVYDYNGSTYESMQIIKYNLLTQEKRIILENPSESPMPIAWNTNGKLAFIKTKNQTTQYICTLNEDGSNYHEFLLDNMRGSAEIYWAADNKYLYWARQLQIGGSERFDLMKFTVETNSIETVIENGSFRNFTISKKNQLLDIFGNGYLSINLNNTDYLDSTSVLIDHVFFSLDAPAFSQDGGKIYISTIASYGVDYGLKEWNLNTNSITPIRASCGISMLRNISCSNNGRFIIADEIPLDESATPWKIRLLDLKTGKESILELD